MLQEIRDIKVQNQKKHIFNVRKTHPKDTDEENVQGDTHLIYNSASTRPPPDRQNNLVHHVPNPNHIPNIDDNAFVPQKPNLYELWFASPPGLPSSSSSDEDSTDDNVDHNGWVLMKTGLPLKRVGRGEEESETEGELETEGESETEGEWEMRGGMEEAHPGPSSDAVTKMSGPESDPEAGRR